MTPRLYNIFFWLTLVVFTHNLVGQDQIQAFDSLFVQFEENIPTAKVDSLIAICKKEDDIVSMAVIAHRYAVQRRNEGDAIHYALIEVNALEKEGLTDTTFTKALYNLGRFYYDQDEFKNAIATYEKVILQDDIPLRTAQAYAEAARCYNKLGEFYKSIDYFKRGLSQLEELKDYRRVAIQLMNLAEPLRAIGTKENFEKRILHLLKADSLGKIHGMSPNNKRNLLNSLANHYISEYYYNFERARHYYFLNLKASLEASDSVNISTALNNLSNVYNLERHDSSIYFAELGLSFVKGRETKARLFDNIAEYHLINNRLELALKNIHKALETNLGVTLALENAPDKFQLSQSVLKNHALFCLKKKTEILIRFYDQSGNDKYLVNAVENSLAADQLINLIHEGSSEERSDLLWRKKASEVYFQGAYASSLLQNKPGTFSFMEKNKAFLLIKSISENTVLSNLPKNLSDREVVLKREILELESRISKSKDSSSKDVLDNMLFGTKRLYQGFLDSVRSTYPDHFKDRLEIAPVSLKTSKASLKKDQSLVSFIWNKLDDQDELILGLVTDSLHTETFRIKADLAFKSILMQYRVLISEPLTTKADQHQYQEVAYTLFQKLFPSEVIRGMIKNKDLIIIPDGDLQNIPFEALIPDHLTNEYLINSSNVSYQYSMSFKNYNAQLSRETNGKFIGYSPIDFSGTSLASLKNANEELQAMDDILPGTIMLKENASKKHFLEKSGSYKVIHLATHALTGENPSIIFSDGSLQLNELYSYQNNADLVTLSACKTSLGALAEGEGVLSLTRGFFYSGAKSVVASLWNVNDRSTSTIMVDFYANLEKGESKSEALNNAKRNYIKTHELSEQSPYYWSSFVLIGDNGPMDFSRNIYPYIIALLLLIPALFIFLKKKQKT